MQLSVQIPVQLEAVGMARGVVSRILRESATAQEVIDDAQLLTSEIVTNVLRHAGLTPTDSLGLAVDVSRDRLRVEVADSGSGFDQASFSEPAADAMAGWGLFLVRRLADRWGVTRDAPNVVWFELKLTHRR
jgi:anti-sigma regulatory factor (Ser/Thr protein kinase)